MRHPKWLKKKYNPTSVAEMETLLRSLSLHTVCESAVCPNRSECFKSKTATFMILGENCTRSCRFCAVQKGAPTSVDLEEPRNVAAAAKRLSLVHTVVTSVTRDDLLEGGAQHFAQTVRELKSVLPNSTVEVLIPDFQGKQDALKMVIDAKPEIIGHNIETVPSLYATIRQGAVYDRSLEVLRRIKSMGSSIYSKTGIIVGLGETQEEIERVIDDLVGVGCDMLTIGQYLQPSKAHIPVAEYIHPSRFDEYKRIGIQKGIKFVMSAPLVRSSYNADQAYKAMEDLNDVIH